MKQKMNLTIDGMRIELFCRSVYPNATGAVKAYFSIILNGKIAINDVKLVKKPDGELIVRYPSHISTCGPRAGLQNNFVCPIDRKFGAEIKEAILQMYQNACLFDNYDYSTAA